MLNYYALNSLCHIIRTVSINNFIPLILTIEIKILDEFERLENLYYDLHHRIHNNSRLLKLIYEMHETEIMLAWVKVILKKKEM